MKYILANWKMKLSPKDEIALARKVKKLSFDPSRVTVSIHPTFLSIHAMSKLMSESPVAIGAQDAFYEDNGAYTGEISPEHLRDLNCAYVLIGHSERRRYCAETDKIINKKAHAVINERMVPVICVGESLEEREGGNKDHIVRRQVEQGLHGIALVGAQKLIVAYEPMWAIGTGIAATSSAVKYMHQVIYHTLFDIFPKSAVAHNAFVIYGGSVDKTNVADFLKEDAVDGVLVGGASLKFDEFSQIISIAESF